MQKHILVWQFTVALEWSISGPPGAAFSMIELSPSNLKRTPHSPLQLYGITST
jgi:hypothetical protein